MVSQGMTRLHKLVQHQPVAPRYQSASDEESANAATTTDSEGLAAQRGQCNKTNLRKATQSPIPLSVHVAITVPPREKKEPHPSGPKVIQIGGGTIAIIKQKIQQNANIAQNMRETA